MWSDINNEIIDYLSPPQQKVTVPKQHFATRFKTRQCQRRVYIYLPFRMIRMWYKVNFKAEFNRFEFRVFLLLDVLPYQS